MTLLKDKICTKCEEEKPFSEFTKRVASKDGLGHRCKPCVSLYQAARRNGENRERILAEKRDWFKKNKEEISIKSKVHYEANKERILAGCKAYRDLEANKLKAKVRQKNYYRVNKEKVLAKNKAWNEAHKDHIKGTMKKWRKRKWNNEQLNYAWKKLHNKRTGMYEIPILRPFEKRKLKKELEKRKAMGFK